METISHRSICASDDALMFDLYASVRAEELGMAEWDPAMRDGILRMQFTAQQRGYAEQYPSAEHCLILVDGSARGWMIVDRGGSAVHVVDLALTADMRGKGIGTSLLRGLQDEAAANGRPLVLETSRTNARAIALYSRLGFQTTEANETHVRMEWRRT